MELLEWGLLGLFCGTFLSATLIPFPSDLLVVGAYVAGFSVAPVLIIATVGNTLGGLTNYVIGYAGNKDKLQKRFSLDSKKLDLWEARLSKWGIFLGLISWLPFLGEPMLAACGFFKVKVLPLSLMMLAGKFLRYLTVTLIYFYGVQIF